MCDSCTLYTLILRGPSRRARLLLGVSMVIILSRPLSREPNTFPPLFFFPPLSSVTAMSNERDLESKQGLTFSGWSFDQTALTKPFNQITGLHFSITTETASLSIFIPFSCWHSFPYSLSFTSKPPLTFAQDWRAVFQRLQAPWTLLLSSWCAL